MDVLVPHVHHDLFIICCYVLVWIWLYGPIQDFHHRDMGQFFDIFVSVSENVGSKMYVCLV